MDNLHRDLAPISSAAWADLEQEARRTFTRHVAARRIVDVPEAAGLELAAVNTGHLDVIEAPDSGVEARLRRTQPMVELRVPFTVDRRQVDDVARGAKDPDWSPVKYAARKIAFAEDRVVFEGFQAAGVTGLRHAAGNHTLSLPADPREYPNVVSQAVSELRLSGVDGPYTLALSADAFTAASETSDHGYPIHEHLRRQLGGEIVWAPAIDGAFLISKRGGDFTLQLGEDLSIGYLSHDADTVELYFQESLTFLVHTEEAVVSIAPAQ